MTRDASWSTGSPKSRRRRHRQRDWTRAGALEDFIAAFEDWHFDWLDVPAMIRAAETILEFPMVDQDPLPWWTQGRVTLLGDAAHPMYPRGLERRRPGDPRCARALRCAGGDGVRDRCVEGVRGEAAAGDGRRRAHEPQQPARRDPARSVRANWRQAVRPDRGRHNAATSSSRSPSATASRRATRAPTRTV